MDFHALQQKLFQLDPTDPREDLAKLRAAAQGQAPAVPAKDYVAESVEVPKNSLPLDINSVNDFAKLAGITLKEAPVVAEPVPQDLNKVGMGAKMVGAKLGAKGGAGMMSKALDKVAQGGALPANLSQQIAPFAKQLEVILGDSNLRNKFMALVKAAEQAQKQQAAAAPAQESIKARLFAELAKYDLKK